MVRVLLPRLQLPVSMHLQMLLLMNVLLVGPAVSGWLILRRTLSFTSMGRRVISLWQSCCLMHLGCRSAAPRAGALPVPLTGHPAWGAGNAHRVRRGERSVEWMGGPLWHPVWGTGMPAMPLPKKTYLCKL